MSGSVIICESPNKAPHIAEYSGMDCIPTYDLLAGKRTRRLKLRNAKGVNYEARVELKGGRVAPVFEQ